MASQAREFQTGGLLPLVKTTGTGSEPSWNISHSRGSRLEWCVDGTGHGQNNLYLQKPFGLCFGALRTPKRRENR